MLRSSARPTLVEAQGGRPHPGRPLVERGADALDGCEHMVFAAPQRRQAALSQPALQLANITVTQGQVVDEVDGVGSVVAVDRSDVVAMHALQVVHEVFQPGQVGAHRRPVRVTPRRSAAQPCMHPGDPPRHRQRCHAPNSMGTVGHRSQGLCRLVLEVRCHDSDFTKARVRPPGPKDMRRRARGEFPVNGCRNPGPGGGPGRRVISLRTHGVGLLRLDGHPPSGAQRRNPEQIPTLLHEAYEITSSVTTRCRLAAALARSWVCGGDAVRAARFDDELGPAGPERHRSAKCAKTEANHGDPGLRHHDRSRECDEPTYCEGQEAEPDPGPNGHPRCHRDPGSMC